MKRFVRFIMNAMTAVCVSILIITMALFVAPCVLIARGWRSLEVWAFYDGDAAKRDLERWKQS